MSFFRLLRRWSRAEWMAASAALFCCVVGVLDMLAWHLHLVPWLTYPAGSMPMVHNTALLFFLSGISVLAVLARWPRMGLWIGIVVAAIAAAVELQYLANVDFGIDQLLCRAYLPGFSHPGGMAPNTALCFIAAGAALALANGRWRFALRAPLIGLLGSAVAVLGLAALLGYAISLATAYTWIASTPMALLTAVSLVILGIGNGALAWAATKAGAAPGWLAYVVLTGLASASALLWQALDAERRYPVKIYSSSPEVTLALGLVISLLAAGAIALAQMARRQARATAASNLQLAAEIEQRRQAERELQRMNRALRALSDCNQLLLHAPDEQSLLEGVCRILVEQCGYALAWVGHPQQDEAKTVRAVAAEGVAKDYLTPGLVTWADEERGRGPTGTAIRTGKTVTLDDASTDPRFGPWRERALSKSFHSSVCLPVDIGESLPAGLTIYSTQKGAFQGEELKLLAELAQDLGYGIRMLRMRAEREQAEHRMRYLAAIVESSEDAIYSKDMEGRILSWNRGAEKIYGYTAEEMVGQPVARLAAPEQGDEVERILERIRGGETVEHYETVRLRKDGTRCDVSVTVSPIHDPGGRITGASSIARDITDRKHTARRLAQQQFYTRSLIEASLDPLVTISREGKVTDVNRATVSVTGVSREELVGSDFCDYFSEPEQARAGYQQVFAEGFVRDYPLAIRHSSGRLTDVLYHATVFRNQDGEVEGVFAAARDITERKLAERRLQEQQYYARSLLEASLDPLVTISREGKITDVNRATETITEVARDRLIGSDFCDYFTEPRKARDGYQQVFAKGMVQDYALAIRHISGQVIDVLYNATLFRSEAGEIKGVFAAARDVTKQKRAESEAQRNMEELERSNAELQDFASIASHDLQEPLRKVLAFGEHLKEHSGDKLDDLGRDFLARMQNAAQRMSGLIDALLEYSRVATRALPFQLVDMLAVVFGVVADMEERIAKSHARIEVAAMPQVMADPMQVRQLVQNLVGNALKFQRPGTRPHVVIEGRTTGRGWSEISVRDNGIGFEEKYLDRIFRPFQRLHGRTEYEGSGMGLAICRKVVARHEGTITAHSAPGEGSTFVVTLPAAPQVQVELQERKEPWLTEKAAS